MHEEDYILITELNRRYFFPKTPVPVVINSGGGSNNYATPVYDYIRLHNLDTIAEGSCQSFAFTIFTAGKKRISYASTVFMVHGSDSIGGSRKNMKKANDNFSKNFWEPWCDYMASISTKPKEYWRELVKDPSENHYFSAKELKAMGVVTHIIGENI